MTLQRIRSFPALSKLGLGKHSIGREACARVVHCIQSGVISEVGHMQGLKCTFGRLSGQSGLSEPTPSTDTP